MGLLMLGLAGFGATSLTGTVRSVAQVGDEEITVDAYARELQREMRAIESQTGQSLTMAQARDLGVAQNALAQLVALASIDNETAQLGISIGDENLQRDILTIPAFRGSDGEFDREIYRYTLEQSGLSESEFENDLRRESARTIVQGAILSGVSMPPVMVDTMLDYVGARRSFTYAILGADALTDPRPTPSDADLQAYYDAHPDAFTLPETKQITFAALTPDMILDQVEIDEDSLRRLYEDRSTEYIIPERRLVERLVYPDEATASAAKAQLEVGGTTFEQLVQDRGLSLGDIDMGDVTATDLDGAGQAVFAANVGDVVGPLPSVFGPALFRVNGTLAARSTDFDTARPQLFDELAGERARRLIEAQAEDLEDRLAGGATPQDLALETDMELGEIAWDITSEDGIAAYDAFRAAADAATLEDFPEITFLEDGGVFALQVTEVLPPRPEPMEQAIDRVTTGWQLEQTQEALRLQANQIISDLAIEGDFADLGLPLRVENGLTRTAYIDGVPADFMTQVFEMAPGDFRVIAAGEQVFIVRLDDTLPPEDTAQLTQMRDAFAQQLDQALAQALFEAFVSDAQLRAQPMVDQAALNAVQNSFP